MRSLYYNKISCAKSTYGLLVRAMFVRGVIFRLMQMVMIAGIGDRRQRRRLQRIML